MARFFLNENRLHLQHLSFWFISRNSFYVIIVCIYVVYIYFVITSMYIIKIIIVSACLCNYAISKL